MKLIVESGHHEKLVMRLAVQIIVRTHNLAAEKFASLLAHDESVMYEISGGCGDVE